MPIISAAEARRITLSREQQVESFIAPWRNVFNTKVKNTAQGSRSDGGKSWTLFEISAASEILKVARDTFIQEVRDAGFKAHLHDQDDDGDYFVYKISWEA